MNGKNDLSEESDSDLDEMARVGSDSSVNIVVEQGSMNLYSGEFGEVKRLYIGKQSGTNPGYVLLDARKKIDMGDWKEVVRFVKYAKKNFPAEKYMLVIWNHGTGWVEEKGKAIEGTAPPSAETLNRGISYDDETHNDITVPEMRAMLKAIGGIDLLAADACLMADIAVSAEISGYAPYVVASQEIEPPGGYDYSLLLKSITDNPGMDGREAALATLSMFARTYSFAWADATTSVVDSARLSKFIDDVRIFVQKAVATSDKPALAEAYFKAQRFYDRTAADFYDFLKIASERTSDAGLKAHMVHMMAEISGSVVIGNAAFDKHDSRAHGISVYMPPAEYSSDYDKLLFGKYTGWGRFVELMLKNKPAEKTFFN
ncbi:MAG: clostripain-related cysteine peptidase, partial [Elusimicrobiaceae bacterium]|nr:clostripain-related cysteine peptidase [Elusimicrobiaceae bacterium]